ncbi:hypothetical protein J6T66_06060 [bacterium]|nr:hypothetical protein [bacterium]
MTFNSLDKEEAFSLDEINKDLDDLKDTVIEQNNTEIENKIISDIQL